MDEPTKIYLATSWSCPWYPSALATLRGVGFLVYDFRREETVFQWGDFDPNWKSWSPGQALQAMGRPEVRRAFQADKTAIDGCDVLILLLPCGASAHSEFGYATGQGKRTLIVMPPKSEWEWMKRQSKDDRRYLEEKRQPGVETMYLFADRLCLNVGQAIEAVQSWESGDVP